MNILMINANLYGHINPTLGLVSAFARGGHRVDYFCQEAFARQAERAGARWIGYGEALEAFLRAYRPSDRHPFYTLMEYMLSYDEAALPKLLAVAEKAPYDMIVGDSYFAGACFLQRLVPISVVCSHASFAMSKAPVPERMLAKGFHPQLDRCYEILDRICNAYRIKPPSLAEVFVSKGDRNIVYTTRLFNGDDALDEPEYLFAGPSLDRPREPCDVDLSAIGDRKLVYVALGSFNTDHADFYRACIAAFRGTERYVCMAIGDRCDASRLGDVPDNVLVRPFLPQLDVLRRADVFITHAGFNSVNEALCFGVPMLALPQVNDQPMVAKRVVALGLGMQIDSLRDATPDMLRDRTEAILADSAYRDNALRFAREMNDPARLARAVEVLEDYAQAWKEGRAWR